ncbi:MAG: toxin-antitoxin system HicB family antitoxin [Methylobacter sp.]|nr:toxin-antitoxin system HicB family antitoxin [Methylobacter sp.]
MAKPCPRPWPRKITAENFRVRVPSIVHRALAMQAAEQGVSLNRLASAKWPQLRQANEWL